MITEYWSGGGVKFRYPKSAFIDLTRPELIEIGNNVDINANFTILTHDFGTFVFRELYQDFVASSGKVKIGNNIYFGRDVTILKGVTIGDNCIIGIGSIVTKDIPSNSVACGSPCKVISSIDEYYHKRKVQQVSEALEYGHKLSLRRGGVEKIKIEDFTEEWCVFLSRKDYYSNPGVKNNVDYRLKGRVDINVFLEKKRPFPNYDSFLKAIEKM